MVKVFVLETFAWEAGCTKCLMLALAWFVESFHLLLNLSLCHRMISEIRRDLWGQMIVDSLHLQLWLESYFRSQFHILRARSQIPGAHLSNIQWLCIIDTVCIFGGLNLIKLKYVLFSSIFVNCQNFEFHPTYHDPLDIFGVRGVLESLSPVHHHLFILCLDASLEFIWQHVLLGFFSCILHEFHYSLLVSVCQVVSVL